MAGRALLAGYPRYVLVCWEYFHVFCNCINSHIWPQFAFGLGLHLILVFHHKCVEQCISIPWYTSLSCNTSCAYKWLPITICAVSLWRHSNTTSLHWRHNDHDGVSNHQPHGCSLNRFQTQIKENIKAPRHWPLCGEFTGTGEFPAQRASYAENVSIWWRHHDGCMFSKGGPCSVTSTFPGHIMRCFQSQTSETETFISVLRQLFIWQQMTILN